MIPPAFSHRLIVLGFGSAAAWVINAVGLAYVARTLGATSFGLLAFGLSVAAYAAVVAAPGLNVWGVRVLSRDRSAAGRLVVAVNGSQFALGLLAYLVVALYAWRLLGADEQRVVLVAGVLVFSASAGTQWLSQGLERYDYMALTQIVTAAVTLAGLVAFVRGPADILAVPIVMLGGQVAASAITMAILVSRHLIRLARVRPSEVLAALRTSLALGVAPIIITVLHNSNTLILQANRGPEAVGLFISGYRLVEMLAIVPTLITSLFFPRLSRMSATSLEWTQTMRPFVSLTMTLAFFPAALMILEAEGLTRSLFGESYDPAAGVVRLMGVAVLFNFAAIAYLMAILSAHQDRQYVVAIGITAIISVAGGLLLVPPLGTIGATLVVSALDLITWLLTLPTVKRLSGVLFLSAWRRPALACLAAGAVLMIAAAAGVPFLVRVIASAVAYSVVILVGGSDRAAWLRG